MKYLISFDKFQTVSLPPDADHHGPDHPGRGARQAVLQGQHQARQEVHQARQVPTDGCVCVCVCVCV